MKNLVVIFAVLISSTAFGFNHIASKTGNWNDASVWNTGTLPLSNDVVSLNSKVAVSILGGELYGVAGMIAGNDAGIFVNAAGILTVQGNVETNNNTTLNIAGTMNIYGDLIVHNNLNLSVSGTLTVFGNVELKNGASLTVSNSGNIEVVGNFSAGTNTDLAVDGTVAVDGNFTVGANSTATGSGSITIGGSCSDSGSTVCESATLPVKLLFFNARTEGNVVSLNWATNEEENFDYFSLERSTDGQSWESLGEVKGNGWSLDINNYSMNDEQPVAGVSYYRLKAVDLDGTFEYHPAISSEYRGVAKGFDVYPNPSNGSNLNIRMNFSTDEDIEVTILDMQGNVSYTTVLDGFNETVNPQDQLQNGIYTVQLRTASGQVFNQRLMVR